MQGRSRSLRQWKFKKKTNIDLGGCKVKNKVIPVFGKYDSRLIYDKKEPELQEFTDSVGVDQYLDLVTL